MAGNVKEWCWNESRDGKRFILGGGFGEPSYMFTGRGRAVALGPQAELRLPLRQAARDALAGCGRPKIEFAIRDFSKEKPVSDEVFKPSRGSTPTTRST